MSRVVTPAIPALCRAGLLCAAALSVAPHALAVESAPSADAAVPADAGVAQWQPRKLDFHYTGFTTLYSCSGLEDKVRDILLLMGARKDVKVRATGCAEGMNRPSKFAWVTADFAALAPATDAAAKDAVKAQWATVKLAPHRPSFMGDGECELVEQLQAPLQQAFALRNTAYHVSCLPHQVSVGDYAVSTEVLKAQAP